MTEAESDPVIDEIRELRKRIAARFGNDPARLVAYYIELQEQHRERLNEFDRLPAPVPNYEKSERNGA
jgi:hypothetical protein